MTGETILTVRGRPYAHAAALERDLSAVVRGEVCFDRLTRTLYATDASIYEIIPAGVVFPRDAEDVRTIIRVCGRHRTPIVARGAGTGIAGGAVGGGVQLDFSRHMNRILSIDADKRIAVVEPGVVLDDLNAALAPFGLQFAPDVATSSRATIGGMIANNSCGARSVLYGRTVDHVAALTVILADGSQWAWDHHAWLDLAALELQTSPSSAFPDALVPSGLAEELSRIRDAIRPEVLARYPRVMRRNGGYALDRLCGSSVVNPATLVCGSEGTLALVVEATLRLVPLPRHRALLVVQFDSVLDAVGAAVAVLPHGPAAVELIDSMILAAGAPEIAPDTRRDFLSGLPAAILVCELIDDDAASLQRRMDTLQADLVSRSIGTRCTPVFSPHVQAAVWEMRKRGFGLLMSRPGDRQPHEFIEDAAIEPARLRGYIRDLGDILREEGVAEIAYYAHASVGVIHVRPVLNLKDPADVRRMHRIADRASSLVLQYGGAFTGEHGDGLVRSSWLEKMYGSRIVQAFREVKAAFDPGDLLNPGKIVGPPPMTESLRYAADAWNAPARTYFDYGAHGSPLGLAGMCSGVGQCRQKHVGTMCPSYMATLQERDTTRARANALRAAIEGRGLLQGLSDPALCDVMDLCLACKACRSECPTGVDMARLKAEWLAHRHEHFGVPRADRFFAAAAKMTRLAAKLPRWSDAVLQSGPVRAVLERVYGLDRRIAPPRFSPQTFRAWHRRRARGGSAGAAPRGRVVYFADTWTDAYWPGAGIAAVRLLEAAGFEVVVPPTVCCGRTLISRGLLAEARRLLRDNVARLAPLAYAGCAIVGSEPSCILTFVDEAPLLLRSAAARRVAAATQTVDSLLAGVLRDDPRALPLCLGGEKPPALFHGHCHQKALTGTRDSMALLVAAGRTATELNAGCCGMAGGFGHERRHYDVSRLIGEERLFPSVRDRGASEIAVTGFSCREQIRHHTGVSPRHVLEIIADGLC